MTEDEVLSRLAEISRLIESHRTAIFVLEQERFELQAKLRTSGWKPPEVPTT